MEDENDKFPLHTAARQGAASVVERLIKNDPKLAKKVDDNGRYAIHWAASSNHHDVLLLLSDQKGFDPDIQDASGWTPLMISASVPDSEKTVELLLQRDADVNAKNNAGQTALHFVSSKKYLDTARLLIEHKASTRVRDKRGQYAVHRAAAAGSAPIVSLLLKNRSPLNATDNEGYTPLHHAVAEGHGDTAVVLLKEGADHTLKTSADESAMDLAPDSEVRKYILQGCEREGIELS